MRRYEWNQWTSRETTFRRAGGRRRFNAMRRRRADQRRAAIVNALGAAILFPPRGLISALAARFGVHRSTISRDLRLMLFGGRVYSIYSGEELVWTVTRAHAGGRILSVADANGNEIRGAARRDIVRRFRRSFH